MRASAPSIVLVDDDLDLLRAMQFALEMEGYKVVAFATARALLRAPAAETACMVVDQRLPDMDGLELIARLRADGRREPAILITTNASGSLSFRAAALQVPIVEKPLLTDTLFTTIRQLIDHAAGRSGA